MPRPMFEEGRRVHKDHHQNFRDTSAENPRTDSKKGQIVRGYNTDIQSKKGKTIDPKTEKCYRQPTSPKTSEEKAIHLSRNSSKVQNYLTGHLMGIAARAETYKDFADPQMLTNFKGNDQGRVLVELVCELT